MQGMLPAVFARGESLFLRRGEQPVALSGAESSSSILLLSSSS
jgi:hypothetical protein